MKASVLLLTHSGVGPALLGAVRGVVGPLPLKTAAVEAGFHEEAEQVFIRATAVIRGLRAISDFEFEFQMALMNRKLEPAIETVFLMPREEYTYVSSRIVKEIARLGGDVRVFVPAPVIAALRAKLEGPRP